MKKIYVFLFAFLMCLSGGMISTSYFSNAEDISYREIVVSDAQTFVSTLNSASTYNDPTVKIILNDDLDFTDINLSSLYQERRTFQGVLDGNGYTISNITLSSNMYYYGIFPYANGATIENLRLSGEINFELTSSGTPIYAGVLVGYGINVTIRNCELYNTTITTTGDSEETVNHSTDLELQSNITFGGLAGRLTSITSGQSQNSRIENCVNYYDYNIDVNRDSLVTFGGIVGSIGGGSSIVNCLYFGDINVTNNISNASNSQYFGGVAGEIEGEGSRITNTANGGNIIFANDNATGHRGAIVGYLNCPQVASNYNVNFSYWTQGAINFYGNGYNLVSDKLSQVSVINMNFLTNSDYFDTRELGFNFSETWSMINSEIVLQNFQEFYYEFSSTLDYGEGRILESVVFSCDGTSSQTLTTKYGKEITIELSFGDNYNGYYRLSSVAINTNTTLSTDYYQLEEVTNVSGRITGYNIRITASDATDGAYSFNLVTIPYSCMVTVSQDAIDNGQGGVRVVGASSSTTSMNLFFSDTNRNINLQAVGSGIYTFAYWEIYYRDTNGDFTVQGTLSDDIRSNMVISQQFGSAPFDREFMLVAYFTDEEAILISIDGFTDDNISGITISGAQFEGEAIAVSPSSSSVIVEITTSRGYVLDVEAFTNSIARLYGNNPTDTLIVSEPLIDDEGRTTYQFRLNMRYMQDSLEGRELNLTLQLAEDGSANGNDLLWVYIVVPIVAVLIIGLIIFLIIRKRRGGRRPKAPKEKKQNYRDYYI